MFKSMLNLLYDFICVLGFQLSSDHTLVTALIPDDCWRLNGTHYYSLKRSYGAVDFDTAALICRYRNSTLASIHSVEENEFLDDLRHQNVAVPVWIGMRRKEYAREWVDGTSLDFIAPYEAVAYKNACIYLFQTWYEGDCDSNLYFICKKEATDKADVEICKDEESSTMLKDSTQPITTVESSPMPSPHVSVESSYSSQNVPETDQSSYHSLYESLLASMIDLIQISTDLTEPESSSLILISSSSSSSVFTTLNDPSVPLLSSERGESAESFTSRFKSNPSFDQESYRSNSFSEQKYLIETSDVVETVFQSTDQHSTPLHTNELSSLVSNDPRISTLRTWTKDLSIGHSPAYPQTELKLSRDVQSHVILSTELSASSVHPMFDEEEFNKVLEGLRVKKKLKVVAKEAPGGETIGAVAMMILFAIFAGVVLLDLGTIHNHIKLFMRNVKGVCQKEETVEGQGVEQEMTSL